MDINTAVSSLAAQTSQAQTGDAVNMVVLKKAINLQAAAALQILEALPQPANPAHLGQSVDVSA
ncbi:MAG: YjfB family protein [Zoogloeaceae bacterium]|jgi:hypothetical protein|nr:YjfB family protein [Zoogloeaceae bacterium]